MNKAEFDTFADEYQQLHRQNIRISAETPEFFHEYKVKDTAVWWQLLSCALRPVSWTLALESAMLCRIFTSISQAVISPV